MDQSSSIMSYTYLRDCLCETGPLVLASLRASVRAKKPIQMYAVEKNPNAVCALRNHDFSVEK